MDRNEAYEWNKNSHDRRYAAEIEDMEESIHYLLKKCFDHFEKREQELRAEFQQKISEINLDHDSRTCENCKYNIDGNCMENLIYVSNDFGCNKFERKQ